MPTAAPLLEAHPAKGPKSKIIFSFIHSIVLGYPAMFDV